MILSGVILRVTCQVVCLGQSLCLVPDPHVLGLRPYFFDSSREQLQVWNNLPIKPPKLGHPHSLTTLEAQSHPSSLEKELPLSPAPIEAWPPASQKQCC